MESPIARIFLAEASIELVPKVIWNHPDVIKTSRRYGVPPSRLLLEKSLHFRAMDKLKMKWKRGRPDILHVLLLSILDSPLAKNKKLEIYFSTINGRIFQVDPTTRIPVSYERFRGLIAQLLAEGRVPVKGKPLIYETNITLPDLANQSPRVIVFWEKGVDTDFDGLVSLSRVKGSLFVIGAFPKGDFSEEILELPRALHIRLYKGVPVKAWSVVSRLICALEKSYKLI